MSLLHGVGSGLGGSGDSGGALGSFYSTTIGQSLRMNKADSPRLIDSSVSSDGNRRKFTFSFWIKFAKATELYDVVIGAGGSASYPSAMIGFHNQRLTYKDYRHPSYTSDVITTAKFRDVSSWYHFVVAVDTEQSTAANRVKMYVNGTQLTDFDTASYPSEDYDTLFQDSTSGNEPLIGFTPGFDYMDGYLADIYNVDNAQLAPTEFGETKDGVWIPKEYSGSFGTTGYHLTFSDSSSIGADSSGNSHSFDTVTNLAATDVVKDSPTNNFPTMNNLVTVGKGQSIFGAFTEGALKVRNTASNYSQAIATQGVTTGKYYYECYITEAGYPSWMIGWMVAGMNGLRNVEFPTNAGAADAEQASFTGFGYFTSSNLYISDWGDTSNGIATQQFAHSGAHSAGDAPTTGDIIGVAADFDNRKLYWHINGEYINSGSGTSNPSTGANANSTYTASEAPDANHKFPWLMGYGTSSFVFNFGQDDSFAGNKTSGSAAASDGDGNGEFYYAVPTGFKALCTSNFPDVTIGPGQSTLASDVFGTVLYSGNSGTNAITGLGFQPDWVWVKSRTNTYNHESYDSVRGVNKRIYPDSPNAEDTGSLSAFGSDGFTHTSGSIGGNASGQTYVGWCWKAGTSFSNDASSTSVGNVDSAGSVNQAAGFGIIGYTGVGQSEMDIAHGLGTTPELIWLKDRDTNSNNNQFHGWHKDISTDYIYLSGSGASATEGDGYGTFKSAHTDALVKFRTNGSANTMTESGDKYIMYLFFSVEGYSMVGTHKGNGADDGTYVYTGFRPAYVIIKNVDSSGSWIIFDSTREGGVHNIVNDHLMADTTADEGTDNDIDFLSNGFKCRRASASFNTAHQFIFLAIADLPFKFANAR
jgi:hypothetical protein